MEIITMNEWQLFSPTYRDEYIYIYIYIKVSLNTHQQIIVQIAIYPGRDERRGVCVCVCVCVCMCASSHSFTSSLGPSPSMKSRQSSVEAECALHSLPKISLYFQIQNCLVQVHGNV